ncbi:MAG: hypothetical protein BGO43_09555 [Gammaproteobacteria bacterium 39-13]|nr:hypothetical protein [Gammaproteobacteria bacterium]OJV93886.1 MAG: hypothetical protein BGO43_09555 [Gammaproteobacteria bacterium 39-13]
MLDGIVIEDDAVKLFPEIVDILCDRPTKSFYTESISCEMPQESPSSGAAPPVATSFHKPRPKLSSKKTSQVRSQATSSTSSIAKKSPEITPNAIEKIEREITALSSDRLRLMNKYNHASGRKQKNAISAKRSRLERKISKLEDQRLILILQEEKTILKAENTRLLKEQEKHQNNTSLIAELSILLPLLFQEYKKTVDLHQGLVEGYKMLNEHLLTNNTQLEEKVQWLTRELVKSRTHHLHPTSHHTQPHPIATSYTPGYQQLRTGAGITTSPLSAVESRMNFPRNY